MYCTCTRRYSGLGLGRKQCRHAQRFEKDLEYSGVNPIRSTGSRYLFPFDMCLSPSYTSPQPFSSLQMLSLPSYHSMLFSTAIPSPCSCSQETPSNLAPLLPLLCMHLPAQPLNPKKDFSFPFLPAPNYMRHLPRRKVKRLSKCRPTCFL